jgi:NADH-dependent peroxiredoxin subunit F
MYDLIIIGGGPGGVAAGVYAARKQLKTLFITDEWGGQSTVSDDIQNWIGTPHISGLELAENFKKHLEEYAADIVTIMVGKRAEHIEKKGDGFIVRTSDGVTHETKTVLITVGSTRRKLSIPGADIFENKGITYCASCDGPLFSKQDVVVIGGGNAAFESAAQLLAYTKSVTLLQRGTEFRADPVTVKRVLEHPNMKALTNVELVEVKGGKFVEAIAYKDVTTGEIVTLPTAGLFVEIGLIPSTDFAKDAVERNGANQIIVDPRTQQTRTPGIWAAGDCTDILYHQNNIAAGDAVRALEDIYMHVKAK